jgi:hypothetical protein
VGGLQRVFGLLREQKHVVSLSIPSQHAILNIFTTPTTLSSLFIKIYGSEINKFLPIFITTVSMVYISLHRDELNDSFYFSSVFSVQ